MTRKFLRTTATEKAALQESPTLASEPARDEQALILPLSLIELGKDIRSKATGIDALAEDIKRNGLLQPLVVRRRDDGRFELIAGRRRFQALQKLGIQDAPVRVQEVDEQSTRVLRLIENLQREDLGGWDTVQAVAALMPVFDNNQTRVAEAIGKDQSYVSKCLSVRDAGLNYEHVHTWSLRDLILAASKAKQDPAKPKTKPDRFNNVVYREGSRHAFALKVAFHPKKTSPEVRERLVERLQYLLTKLRDAAEADIETKKQDGAPSQPNA